MTEVQIVMAPTAISPPYLRREELKHTLMTLSVLCMINVLIPRPRQGKRREGTILMFFTLSLNNDFSPVMYTIHHTQETPWLMTVANAAPLTPIPKAKMKIGSRIILTTAPITTVSMLIVVFPWAVIKAFIPSVICTHMVPKA